jgi:hypothetical protein
VVANVARFAARRRPVSWVLRRVADRRDALVLDFEMAETQLDECTRTSTSSTTTCPFLQDVFRLDRASSFLGMVLKINDALRCALDVALRTGLAGERRSRCCRPTVR